MLTKPKKKIKSTSCWGEQAVLLGSSSTQVVNVNPCLKEQRPSFRQSSWQLVDMMHTAYSAFWNNSSIPILCAQHDCKSKYASRIHLFSDQQQSLKLQQKDFCPCDGRHNPANASLGPYVLCPDPDAGTQGSQRPNMGRYGGQAP